MDLDTARVIEHLAELKQGQVIQAAASQQQSRLLRMIVEQLMIILEKLTPGESDGPTIQELLAAIVTGITDNGMLLRRIDRRTESMAAELPFDVVRAMTGAGGANGNGTVGEQSA